MVVVECGVFCGEDKRNVHRERESAEDSGLKGDK